MPLIQPLIALVVLGASVLGPISKAPAQTPVPQPPPATQAAVPDPIGSVATLQGSATVTRGATAALALKVDDEIFKGDILHTAIGAALGVIFDDETTFNLSGDAS